MHNVQKLPNSFALVGLVLLVGCADSDKPSAAHIGAEKARTAQTVTPKLANSPLAGANDGSVLTLAGQVVATGSSWFTVGVGQERVIVEMDDWDWFQEGKALKPGDQVTVTGRVDQDIWEVKKLEASSVNVRNLGMTFYASGADEEDLARGLVTADSMSSAQGLVTDVEGQEFTVGGITGPVRIDMSQVQSKPPIKVGDRVYSWGEIDIDPREGVEIMADGVTIISADKTKKIGSAQSAAKPKTRSDETPSGSS